MSHPSTEISASSSSYADAVSRRAYELWEKEGRPDGSDLRHWLQAERELSTSQSSEDFHREHSPTESRNTGTDIRPLQGTRAAAAANRPPKRGSAAPFVTEKDAGKRRSPNTPPL